MYEQGQGGDPMSSEHLCPKCGGKMRDEFLIGQTLANLLGTSAQPVRWVEGSGQGYAFSKSYVRVDRAEMHPFLTYRCEECGYLESYAPKA